MRVDAHVDGQQQIEHKYSQREREMDEARKSETYEHQAFVDAVDRMVKIIAVYRPLSVAHSGESAVKRIPVPVDHESQRSEPEEADILIDQYVACGDHQCAEEAYGREYVRSHPLRLTLRQPHENFLLGGVQYGGLNPFSLFHFLHVLSVLRNLHR